MKQYTVTIGTGVALEDGTKLAWEEKFSFETEEKNKKEDKNFNLYIESRCVQYVTDSVPSVSASVNRYSEDEFELSYSIYKFNTEKQALDAINLKESVPYWINRYTEKTNYDVSHLRLISSYSEKTTGKKLGYGNETLDIKDVLTEGCYLVEASAENTNKAQTVFQVTDIGVNIFSADNREIIFFVIYLYSCFGTLHFIFMYSRKTWITSCYTNE